MQAKDVMRKPVVTVPENMTLRELATLFIERRISGAPVIDEKGRLLGVVSQTDIVRRDRERAAEVEVPSYYSEGDRAVYTSGFQVEDPDYTRVRDVMTPAVLSAAEDAPIEEVARFMLRKRIHRVVITRDGRLCGIISTMDMLRALLDALEGAKPASRRRVAHAKA